MEETLTHKQVTLDVVKFGRENFFKISNSDEMRPFFMSIVSDSNHWMFISSNGGLTAGRRNAEYALFPYYTDDKITESADITGSKSIFLVHNGSDQLSVWEPFSERFEGKYRISRNLYKNAYGNKVLFEEINHDLGLTFTYQWNSSDQYGFVKTSKLTNNTAAKVEISILDGIQNILPYGVGSYIQNQSSNLVDAYKRSELDKEAGLGVYALSAIIVDKAEPSEALKANVAWSLGLENTSYLLSSLQLKNFRRGIPVEEEVDVKAEKGAYFVHSHFSLHPEEEKEWMIIADVNKNHAAVAKISDTIKREPSLASLVKKDIENCTQSLIALNAASDALQLTADQFRDARHFSNTLFNIMRGGIFDHNYQIEKWDFSDYLAKGNKMVFENSKALLATLPEVFSISDLKKLAYQSEDSHFRRLCLEYMPLKFSRRHGDPSRPWNRFSINTRSEDGSKILDYEGNWRDIFQNWEALAHSYPCFVESMIYKFLNATTFDGYNPYRVTKDGFDWETIEPDDPWSYIGYWGDHQIIYLLKLLELSENHFPGRLAAAFAEERFVYANVPYRIKSYEAILDNPKDTIDFDDVLDGKIRENRSAIGADGALLSNRNNTIHQVNFMEKVLASVLAKLSNFIPEGGIWMNTQRPEWNDANNALVGNGVSMVTLYYLRRFLQFFDKVLSESEIKEVQISEELVQFYDRIFTTFDQYWHFLSDEIKGEKAKLILDGLGKAGSDYRLGIYQEAFSGHKQSISLEHLSRFVKLSIEYLEHSIRANRRQDHLYHAYNLMTLSEDGKAIMISYLDEMLEGQVAVLSSGYLSSEETVELLDSMKNSRLFRPDQYSYLLYPNKDLPLFREKNLIPENAVAKSKLLTQLVAQGNVEIIEKDINGQYHFNGNFKNVNDLNTALENLSHTNYAALVEEDKKIVRQIFEEVFNHKAFTGRSGTFFGYEGLGSIYWHMVSKLQLAVQECCLKAIKENKSEEIIGRLLEHYYEINAGIGVHKPPTLYGAFPTDPYSHTPAGKGAQQPGMTGQVKEDIISRFGELGVLVSNGKLHFNPCLLRKEEFLEEPKLFNYVDVESNQQQIQLEKDSLCFTYCQVPIVYKLSDQEGLLVLDNDGSQTQYNTLELDTALSDKLFARTGSIKMIVVQINQSRLR